MINLSEGGRNDPSQQEMRHRQCETATENRKNAKRPMPVRADATAIVKLASDSDPNAAAQLLPLVYDELRRLAADYLAREPKDRMELPKPSHDASFVKDRNLADAPQRTTLPAEINRIPGKTTNRLPALAMQGRCGPA
jgi:hypothetical protein